MLKPDSVGNHTLITLSCADDPTPIKVRRDRFKSG
jgi:hypothetical protein